MKYNVELEDGRHYIRGLITDTWKNHKDVQPDTLLVSYDKEGNPITRMVDAHMMLKALYDLYQTEYGLRHGDVFDTQYGKFLCTGPGVVPMSILIDKSETEMSQRIQEMMD